MHKDNSFTVTSVAVSGQIVGQESWRDLTFLTFVAVGLLSTLRGVGTCNANIRNMPSVFMLNPICNFWLFACCTSIAVLCQAVFRV
jgi:hypothetical protein